MSVDPSHKFELALQLNDFATAYALAEEHSSENRWKQLSDLALRNSDFQLAKTCKYLLEIFCDEICNEITPLQV